MGVVGYALSEESMVWYWQLAQRGIDLIGLTDWGGSEDVNGRGSCWSIDNRIGRRKGDKRADPTPYLSTDRHLSRQHGRHFSQGQYLIT